MKIFMFNVVLYFVWMLLLLKDYCLVSDVGKVGVMCNWF